MNNDEAREAALAEWIASTPLHLKPNGAMRQGFLACYDRLRATGQLCTVEDAATLDRKLELDAALTEALGRVEELERELAQYRIPEQEPGLGPSETDRAAAVRWYQRCQELERELASLRRDYQTSLALEQGLHDRALAAEKELAALRDQPIGEPEAIRRALLSTIQKQGARIDSLTSELAAERDRGELMFHEYQDHLQQRDDGAALLEAALTAERERVRGLEQRVSDLKFALGDGAGWFDRYRAERAKLQRCREVIERVRAIVHDRRLTNRGKRERVTEALSAVPPTAPAAESDDEAQARPCPIERCGWRSERDQLKARVEELERWGNDLHEQWTRAQAEVETLGADNERKQR